MTGTCPTTKLYPQPHYLPYDGMRPTVLVSLWKQLNIHALYSKKVQVSENTNVLMFYVVK